MEENKVELVNETKEEKKKEPMTTKQKVFLGLRIAFNVVFYALIIFLFLFSLMNIRGGNGTDNFPNIFGKGFLSVQSDSMERDESIKNKWPKAWENYKIGEINTGDLVNADVFNPNNADKLQIGDVITFVGSVNGSTALITHRIVDIRKDSQGNYIFTTQGDRIAQSSPYNPNASDAEKYIGQGSGLFEEVQASSIRGVITGVNAGAGKVLDTIQKNWLFIFVIPIIVLLVIEVFLVVRNIMILRGEKNKLELADSKEAMLAEVEAEKEKMRQELLAELRAQGLAPAEDKTAEEPKPEPVAEPQPEPVEEAKEETVVLATATETTDEISEPEVKEEEPQAETQEEKVEETPVEAVETPAEEPAEEKAEEVVEEKTEEAPVEEAQPEQVEEVKEEVAEPEVKEEATEEIRPEIDEDVEEKVEEPKKKAPAKKSASTTTKKASTTKKSTSTTTKKASGSTTKKATTTKKTTTKKTEK